MIRRTAFLLLVLFVCAEVFARVGGGSSYSGGSSSSGSSSSSSSSGSSYSGGGGGGGGEPLPASCGFVFFGFLCLIAIMAIGSLFRSSRSRTPTVYQTSTYTGGRVSGVPLEHLRRFDPNFSRAVFDDFSYSLYAQVHNARGAGQLLRFAPYLSAPVRDGMVQYSPRGLTEVRGIIVGAMEVGKLVTSADSRLVTVNVTFDANMTEVVDDGSGPRELTFYVRERWTFERQRDILSPPPAKSKADHCPRCGAALQTRTDGSCEFCGVKVDGGTFHWFVRSVAVESKEPRGPLLTSTVEEQGTNNPTVFQPHFVLRTKEFEAAHPQFMWETLIERAIQVATELNAAWSSRDWERVRPLETETLFQMHRYWIDAYIRQGLRNIIDDFSVNTVEPVKVELDAFYDAITLRMWASGRDYTVNESGLRMSGSQAETRLWTEYWTFIRTRGTESDPSATVSCPNCGASVVVGQTGICHFCNGKLTGGQFDWVLSRIEQDDSYAG